MLKLVDEMEGSVTMNVLEVEDGTSTITVSVPPGEL